ncbi:PAS domain-containing protein [Bacillus salacetis]|uniref:histidine kinase n=1 Tax=Bacillus salacetis TaxID=2315464 RepID=A0A3A1QU99_9BACI|nr:ATP-binding protein [Bacillus salacetis]RIW28920.1 PAS domain-containing protein [Bacillus salacetis]
MDFALLLSIAIIPLIISLSLMLQSRSPLSIGLSLFLLMLSFWQVEIALLYSHQILSLDTIDSLFRIFRAGPIMIMPIIYFFTYYLVRNNPGMTYYKKFFNRKLFWTMISYSVLVYAINFTSSGVQSYTWMPSRMLSHPHLLPVYGSFHITYIINIILVFVHTAFLLVISLKLGDRYYRAFYQKLVIGAVFIFVNGVISGFGTLPLYISSFNSILVAVVLFLGFFQMQAQNLNQANQSLAKQSSLLEEIMKNNPNFITVLNKDNRIIKMNDAMESLLACGKEEVVGQDFDRMKMAPFNLEIQEGETVRINCRDGENKYVQWGSKVLNQFDEESYTLYFGVDLTNQKMNEQLQLSSEKSKVIGELSASIAHEIRNPLTTIRGFIQVLKERNNEPQYEKIILEEIDRIDEVLKEMLLLARPEAQPQAEKGIMKIDVHKELCNIKILFNAVAAEQNKELILVNRLDNDRLAVFNPSHFKQVMLNILKNSFEATADKGKIKIKLDETDGNIRIRIIDNGKGISKDRLMRIGEPYYTNKEKGTGIGLTICFKLINDYSGVMRVFSKVGWGTITTILLKPASPEEEKEAESKSLQV